MTLTPNPPVEQEADRVHAVREAVAREVVDEHYRRHPEWWDRWGMSGREATERDTAHHLEFLEASLRANQEEIFTWYSAWLAGILRARDVPIGAVHEAYELIAERLSPHLTSAGLARVRHFLEAGARALEEAPEPVPGTGSAPAEAGRTAEVCATLTRALLEGDRREADRVLQEALARGLSLHALADEVVQPAMTEVGRLWQTNRITVAREHLATATLQTVLATLVANATCEPPCERRVVLACVEGNHHAVGLRAVADVFELAGWDVHYLGADVPTRDLVAYLRENRPEVLGLSLSLPRHVSSARHAVETIRTQLREDAPRILVGGLPVREFPALRRVLGADGVALGAADALEGVVS